MIKKKKILAAEDMPEFQSSIDAMPAESRLYVDMAMEIAANRELLIKETDKETEVVKRGRTRSDD